MAAATAAALDAAAAAEAAVAEALCALETRDDETLDEDAPPEAGPELDAFRPAKGTLLALMGLPAAGKSTLATALKAVDTHDVRVVRFDDDLEASGALDQWAPGKWHEARSKSLRRVQGFVQNLPPATLPYIVVADDNNPLKSMRHALFKIARDHGWAYATVRLECTQQIAEARNAARSGAAKVPQDTIEQMATDLEPPDAGRQGWERFAVTVRTARKGAFTVHAIAAPSIATSLAAQVRSDAVPEVLAAADRARREGPPILPEDAAALAAREAEARDRTLASKKHALDLALRACVSDVASACAGHLAEKKDRGTLGKALADARKDVLKVSEEATGGLDAPRCLELFAAYALGRVALGGLPVEDVTRIREALAASVAKQIYRGDINLHEPPPAPRGDAFPPQPADCAPPLLFEHILADDPAPSKFVGRMRGEVDAMEASLVDAEAPAPAAEAPAPAPVGEAG